MKLVRKAKVARSQETSSLVILLFGAIAMYFFLPDSFRRLGELAKHMYINAPKIHFTAETFSAFFINTMGKYAAIVAPIILAVGVIAFTVSYLQVGPLLSAKAIQPKGDKLNVLKGMKQLVSA